MKKLLFKTCVMCSTVILTISSSALEAALIESFETYSDGTSGYWELPDDGWEDAYSSNLWHIGTEAATFGAKAATWSTDDYSYGYTGLRKKYEGLVDFQQFSYDIRLTRMYASSTPAIKIGANYLYKVLWEGEWVDQWYTPGMIVFEGDRIAGTFDVYMMTGSAPVLASDLVPSDDWFHVEQEFDYANELVRARLNGGDWTNWEPWQTYLYPEEGVGQLDSFKLLRYKFSMDLDGIANHIGEGNPLLGDANCDDVVNELDAAIVATYWLSEGANWGMGDFNGDTVVDDIDATIMAANWLNTRSAATVPEPSTVVLLAAALAVLALRRRGD